MKKFVLVIEGTFEGEGETVVDLQKSEAHTSSLLTKASRAFVGHLGEGVSVRAANLTIDNPPGHHVGVPAIHENLLAAEPQLLADAGAENIAPIEPAPPSTPPPPPSNPPVEIPPPAPAPEGNQPAPQEQQQAQG